MAALQYAACPGITGFSIGSSKLAFRVIEVLMEYFSIGFDRDEALPAISGCDAAFLTSANVAGRRRISLAQKARWAKQKVNGNAPKPKRTISAAGRRRIAAAQRARWAKIKRTG